MKKTVKLKVRPVKAPVVAPVKVKVEDTSVKPEAVLAPSIDKSGDDTELNYEHYTITEA